jgi:hypothetical protein
MCSNKANDSLVTSSVRVVLGHVLEYEGVYVQNNNITERRGERNLRFGFFGRSSRTSKGRLAAECKGAL